MFFAITKPFRTLSPCPSYPVEDKQAKKQTYGMPILEISASAPPFAGVPSRIHEPNAPSVRPHHPGDSRGRREEPVRASGFRQFYTRRRQPHPKCGRGIAPNRLAFLDSNRGMADLRRRPLSGLTARPRRPTCAESFRRNGLRRSAKPIAAKKGRGVLHQPGQWSPKSKKALASCH